MQSSIKRIKSSIVKLTDIEQQLIRLSQQKRTDLSSLDLEKRTKDIYLEIAQLQSNLHQHIT